MGSQPNPAGKKTCSVISLVEILIISNPPANQKIRFIREKAERKKSWQR
jgi:hypothetical protein